MTPAVTDQIESVPTVQSREVAAKPPPHRKPGMVLPSEEITVGSVLLRRGAILPVVLPMDSGRVGDWDLVRGLGGYAVERKLRGAGWHFFFMVPEVEGFAVGFDRQKTFAKALARTVRAVEVTGFNAVEIVATKRTEWLGMHYVKVTAHPRHARHSPFLHDPDVHYFPKRLWDFKRVLGVRSRQAAQLKAI